MSVVPMPVVHSRLSPMPVIVGAPRSGTTLLRLMLDAHPDLAIPPETGFLTPSERALREWPAATGDDLRRAFFEVVTTFPPDAPAWRDFGLAAEHFWAALQAIEPFSVADGYRAFYRAYATRFGKSRWGDKTPLYCLHLDAIARILPEAHFVHVIRDGRDVALSVRRTWFAPGDRIEELAAHWRTCVTTARAQGAGRRQQYLEIRFEDLIRDSEAVLKTVCAFLDLSFVPAMLRYHERAPGRLAEHRDRTRLDGSLVVSHVGRLLQQELTMRPPQASRVSAWAQDMSADEQRRFEIVAGDLLAELGYEHSAAPAPAG